MVKKYFNRCHENYLKSKIIRDFVTWWLSFDYPHFNKKARRNEVLAKEGQMRRSHGCEIAAATFSPQRHQDSKYCKKCHYLWLENALYNMLIWIGRVVDGLLFYNTR
jgi:hypothetical protein